MNDSTQRKVGAILSYVSIIINTLVQLIYTPFLIRMLGQSEYGLYSLISSVIGYLTVLDLGFGNAIIVYTAKYRANNELEKEKKMQGMFKVIFYIIGFISVLIGIVLYANVDNMFGKTMTTYELEKAKVMMLILTFNMFMTFSFSIYSSIISAYEKFIFQKIMSVVNTVLKPMLMIPLLLLGYKSITMTLIISLINLIVLMSNYFFCKKNLSINIKFMGFDKNLFKTLFGYSFFVFLSVIVDKINWSADQFILGNVSGTIAVSVYSVAAQLNSLFINLSTGITGVMLPKISMMIEQKVSNRELTDEMIKVGRIQYFIVFLMASGLILVGKEFIMYWAGDEYELSYYIALLLIIPVCFPLIQNLGISIMQAKNKYKFKAVSTLCMAIVNVIISYFLAQKYGAIGTALGTTIALIVCNIFLSNIYYYKAIKIDVLRFWKEILHITKYFIIPIIAVLLFRYMLKLSGIVSVVIYGGVYVLLYSTVSYYLVMNDYEKKLMEKVLIKIHIMRGNV